MLPEHFYIPGTSGTDIKHKKGFSDIKKHLNKNPQKVDYDVDTFQDRGTRERFSRDAKQQRIGIILEKSAALLSILAIVSFLFMGMSGLSKVEAPIPQQTALEKQATINQHAYELSINNGKRYLEGNQYNEAEKEFTQALKLFPYGEAAHFGMTETLVKKCIRFNEDCGLAKQYLTFIQKKKYDAEKVKTLLNLAEKHPYKFPNLSSQY